MELACCDLFRARWSPDIHEEWISSVLEDRPDLTRDRLNRTRELMDEHIRDCIITDYEPLIDTVDLPDPNDRHVLAAAIRGRVDVIVTYNLKDFPAEVLTNYDLEAQHPDEFIMHLADLHPAAVYKAVKTVRGRLKEPPISIDEYLEILSKSQLPKTVDFLNEGKTLF